MLNPPVVSPTSPDPVEVIHKLLSTLTIGRVVFVDDVFERGIDQVIELVEVGLSLQRRQDLKVLFHTIDFEEDNRQIRDSEIRTLWEASGGPERQSLMKRLYDLKIVPHDVDIASARALRVLLANTAVDYQEVSPQGWMEECENWLKQASPESKLICLFDKEFQYTPDGEQIPLDGIKMLQMAIAAVDATNDSYDGRVLFGVFSHTLTIKTELEEGSRLCSNNQIPFNTFLPIAKERRSELSKLAEGIQMLVLNLYASTMKRIVKNVMHQAANDANAALDKLSVFEFDDIVLYSSLKEGVWEGETLVRLFSLLQQHHGWLKLASPQNAGEFNRQVRIAREIALPRLIKDYTTEDAWQLRRMELYQEGASLNGFHTPLRLGDVFQLKASHQYILLAPPCDLMVRSRTADERGKRGKENELAYVELFRLRDINYAGMAKLNNDQLRALAFLKHYKKGKLGRISFKERIVVPIQVLDLAVLNSDGSCKIDFNNLPPIPIQFHPAWEARYNILLEHFRQLVNPLDGINAILEKPESSQGEKDALEIMKTAYLNPNNALPKSPSYKAGLLDFEFKRVAHYKNHASQHLLAAYANFLSRAAEDHDFSEAPPLEVLGHSEPQGAVVEAVH